MSSVILHDYQKYCYNFILDHPSSLLLLDMGLGKTLITLTAIDTLKNLFEQSYKVLVIAPLKVAKYTWGDEIDKFDLNLTYSKVLGSERDRMNALNKKADIYLINRENVTWLVDLYRGCWPFDFVVIDELSSFKSSQSKRFKSLRKVMGRVKRFIGLTGTPAPNNLMDLWSQVYLADQGARLGRTITSYRNQYFYPAYANGHIVYKYGLKEGAEQQIYQKLEDLAVSMKAKDVLNLPKRIDNLVKVDLEAKERKLYDQMKRDFLLEVDASEIVAVNAAVLSGKLLQLASGAVYDEGGKVIPIHEEKLEALERIVEEAQGEPILVFYQYKHELDRLKKRFPQAQEIGENIREWNKGEIPILLAHPQSAGHGLNLQQGGHIIVWFSLTWSLEYYQQANARLDRQGQKHPVIVHHLIAEDTLDEAVMESLKHKDQGQERLIQALKAEIGGI
ncbi:DEAD/DEAH box helicase [Facklamia hominis]|uniref:Helicase ATP-binding domain-containing protein n=1 Tax=Facklamia hominis CCUG 36813 TaxID=883111 RepID=K1LWM9_9LACT|nr:DEAD/DEAH box helicase [Facklamia hominis]EKB54488.1 hypothetical protein HMPREF9706_00678 [Facklamia hominis CCUG 36813]